MWDGRADLRWSMEQLAAEARPEPEEQDEFTASEHYDAARLEGCRRQVLAEALTTGARFADRTLRVGLSVVVGGYRVFPVLAVRKAALESLPRLHRHQVGGLPVDESFPEAIITDVLRAVSRELDPRGARQVSPARSASP